MCSSAFRRPLSRHIRPVPRTSSPEARTKAREQDDRSRDEAPAGAEKGERTVPHGANNTGSTHQELVLAAPLALSTEARYTRETVTSATQTLLDAALRLPTQERAEFAAILADSVGDGTPAAELDAAWLAEAKQRLAAVRAGAPVVDSDEVDHELDGLLDSVAGAQHAG